MSKKHRAHPGKIRRGTRFIFNTIVVLSFAAFMIWLVGLAWFYNQIPKSLRSMEAGKADLVVVLTGGSSRIDAGIALMNQRVSNTLFISGVGKGVTLDQLLSLSGFKNEQIDKIAENKESIYLGKNAINTRENAEEVHNWIQTHKVQSLYLVTANYHTPRAFLEFTHLMPDTQIYLYPAFPENFKADKWYKDPRSAWIILLEYTKYLAALSRIYVM